MICVHLTTIPPEPPVCAEAHQYLNLPSGKALLVHADCHLCQQPATRLPHVLSDGGVGLELSGELSSFGVTSTDTMLQAMFKVAKTWGAAWP